MKLIIDTYELLCSEKRMQKVPKGKKTGISFDRLLKM